MWNSARVYFVPPFSSVFLFSSLFSSLLTRLSPALPPVLVKHRVVAVHGALTTMQMLLKKPDNRLAAILMATNTVRVCGGPLFGKSSTANPTPMCVCVCVCVYVSLCLSLPFSVFLSQTLLLKSSTLHPTHYALHPKP